MHQTIVIDGLFRLASHRKGSYNFIGDTAQSIMRGIAFRFSDLRSLFYHAKMSMQEMGKTSTVKVPKQVDDIFQGLRVRIRKNTLVLQKAKGVCS